MHCDSWVALFIFVGPLVSLGWFGAENALWGSPCTQLQGKRATLAACVERSLKIKAMLKNRFKDTINLDEEEES